MAHLLTTSTGFDELDGQLPQGGWPLAALTEVLTDTDPTDALYLLAPLFKRLQAQGKSIALLVPPSLSYMPALVRHGLDLRSIKVIREHQTLEQLDSLTTSLRAGGLAALVCLIPPSSSAIQREQRQKLCRAARVGQLSAFLLHSHAVGAADEAALRLFMSKTEHMLQVRRITTASHQASTLHLAVQADPLRQTWPKALARKQAIAPETSALPLPSEAERLPRRSWPFRPQPKPQPNQGFLKGGWARWAA